MACTALLGLAGCKTAKERAQEHYQAAEALLAKGDTARAIVELKTVFSLDGTNHDARETYAELMRKTGDLREAYSQYLRLVEQYPQDLEANRALAEMALASGRLDDAKHYADAAAAIAPKDPQTEALGIAVRYSQAVRALDEPGRAQAAADAAALLKTAPDLLLARRVTIDDRVRAKDWPAALAAADAALKIAPADFDLAQLRLAILAETGDGPAVEAQLKAMIAQFPTAPGLPAQLVAWYVGHHQLDAAEAFLRARAAAAGQDPEPRLDLLRFLAEQRGQPAAAAELTKMLAEPEPTDKTPLLALQAGFTYAAGDHAGAIAALQKVTAEAKPSPDADAAKVMLARMQHDSGDRTAAMTAIDALLATNSTDLEAIRLKAGWLIEADRTGDALVLLRSGLSVAPQDVAILTLMARAYERDGNPGLEGDMLSRAADASGHGVEESLRYAQFLASRGSQSAAEAVLTDALKANPAEPRLLGMLGSVHLAEQNWTAAGDDADRLAGLGTPAAQATADDLRARALAAQSRTDDLMAFLDGLARQGGSTSQAADIALIRTLAAQGKLADALARSQALLAAKPDDPQLQLLHASLLGATGRGAEEQPLLEAMLTRDPRQEAVWTELYRLALRSQSPAAAKAVLERALAAMPEDANLQWLHAGLLERSGDIDGAIAAYEKLYAENSDSPVFANNLASLLAANRSDPESLNRAATIARRLQGSGVPAFQDTWGWITFRLGHPEAAIADLEAAAKGLPQDPSVQYHLGCAYAALGRPADARARFEAARALLAAHPDAPAIR